MNNLAESSSSQASTTPFTPPADGPSIQDQMFHHQKELERLAKEMEAKRDAAINALPQQLGLVDLQEVYTAIGQKLKSFGKANNTKIPADKHDAVNKAILSGASFKEVSRHFKLSSAAYYNRKRKLGLTRPTTALSKRSRALQAAQ